MADFLNDTVQTLGDPLRNMMLALQGNQPAPPATPQGVSGALDQTLLRKTGDDPGNDFMNSTASAAGQAGKVGSPMEWAMALAGGPRLQRSSFSPNHFNILEGDTGKVVGDAMATYNPDKKQIYIDSIGSHIPVEQSFARRSHPDDSGTTSYGTKDTRALLREFQKQWPEAEEIAGYRVSGARDYSGPGAMKASMELTPLEPASPAWKIDRIARKADERWGKAVADANRNQRIGVREIKETVGDNLYPMEQRMRSLDDRTHSLLRALDPETYNIVMDAMTPKK